MNKGRKFFLVLLIIFIVAAILLGGYVAYNYIKNYVISQEASSAVDDFESSFTNVITVEVGDEEQTNILEDKTPTTNIAQSSNVKYKGYNVIGTIQIPKTNVKYPIVDSSTPQAMEVAIVMLYGPGLNQVGNTVIVGHNYRNGGFFGNNKKLVIGDKIYITDSTGKRVEYNITNTYQTSDSDFSYATRETDGKREISLSTCTSDASKRLIIWAKEN